MVIKFTFRGATFETANDGNLEMYSRNGHSRCYYNFDNNMIQFRNLQNWVPMDPGFKEAYKLALDDAIADRILLED